MDLSGAGGLTWGDPASDSRAYADRTTSIESQRFLEDSTCSGRLAGVDKAVVRCRFGKYRKSRLATADPLEHLYGRRGSNNTAKFNLGVALVGTKKTGKGRRKIGRKKRRMRAKIRHRKK